MNCFTKVTHTLGSGNLDEYNENLGDPRKLTTQTYYVQYDSYHTHNVNWSYGISRYEKMKAHIESYTGSSIGCIHVNDLAATYNALNEALGLPDRALNPSQMKNLYKEKDATLPKQPQGKSAIQSKNNKRASWHKLNSRGVQGGKIVVNLQKIKQKIEKERIEKQRLDDIEIEKQRLDDIEAARLAVIFKEKEMFNILNLERIERERQMQNQIITFNEQQNSGDFNNTPITEINLNNSCSECTGTEIRYDPFDESDEDRFETASIGLVRDFEKNDEKKLYPLLFLVPLGIIAYLVFKK
jgi:hypothetical protein